MLLALNSEAETPKPVIVTLANIVESIVENMALDDILEITPVHYIKRIYQHGRYHYMVMGADGNHMYSFNYPTQAWPIVEGLMVEYSSKNP